MQRMTKVKAFYTDFPIN